MVLNYTNFEFYNKGATGVLGTASHGNRAFFELDLDTKDKLNLYGSGSGLNVFEDGTIATTTLQYNLKLEEYLEDYAKIFKDRKRQTMVKAIDKMLDENSILVEGVIIGSYKELENFLKNL